MTGIPDNLLPWLCEVGSLTSKLRTIVADPRIELISEHWECVKNQNMLLRKIFMCVDGRRLWCALTEIPECTYKLKKKEFMSLGERPIGELLFNDPKIKRVKLDYQMECVTTLSDLKILDDLNCLPHSLCCRRSTFMIESNPLNLTEVFLPEMTLWLKSQTS